MAHLYFSSRISISLKKLIFAVFLIAFAVFQSNAQNCTVNAGVLNITICETDALVLQGNTPSPIIGNVLWTQISGPAVVINSPNNPSTTVSGYTGGNSYIFRYSATCGDGIMTYQDKVVNVEPITTANAGGNIASCPNSSGSLTITGNTPQNAGEIAHWEIVGDNNAGVVINFPNLPTSTITLPQTSCGTSTLQWVIEGPEYAPGQRCRTISEITVTNYGGVVPVSAGPDQTLSNCYTTTQSTNLSGSYGGCGLNGQNGQWTFVSGPNTPTIGSPNSNNTQISNLSQGTYTFRWAVTGPCATGTDLVTINVPAATQDVTTLTPGDESIFLCDNTITQVTLKGQAPLYAGETVLWTQTGGTPANIVSPTNPTTLVTGISDSGDPYTFRYTLTNNNTGCVSTKDYIVRYNGATRTISANNGENMAGSCNATVFTIPLTVTGTGSNTYRIISGPASSPLGPFPTARTAVGNSLTLTLTVPGNYVVEFVRSEDGSLPVGCDYGFDTMDILVSGDPVPSNAGSDVNLPCGDTSTILSGVSTGDGSHFWSQISGPNQAVIDDGFAEDTEVSGLIPGTYVFQYITKGGGATCGFSTANVTVNVSDSSLSTPDAGANQVVCQGSQVPLSGSVPEDGEQGEWTQVSGPSTISFSNINDPNAVATGFTTSASLYQLQWTISYLHAGTSCAAPVSDTVDILVTNNIAPTNSNAGPDACYAAGTTVFNLSGNTPSAAETGIWTVTPAAGVVFADDNDPNTAVSVPGNGTYTFTWTISSSIGTCLPSSSNVSVTIATTPPTADAGPDQQICGNTITMAATASSGSVGTWTQISGVGSYTISDIHDPNAIFTFTYSGYYIFRWSIDADYCGQAFDDINLTIGIPPSGVNAGPDQNICDSTSVTMAGSTYDEFFEGGQWSVLTGAPNNPTIVDPTDPNTVINGLVAGTYTFRWTVAAKNIFLCPAIFDDMVVNVAPSANAGPDETFCDVTSVQLEGNENSTGTWTLTAGNPAGVTITQSPSNSYIANATVVPGNVYTFTYTTDTTTFPNAATCPGSSDSVVITVNSGPSINPNAGPDQTLCISDVGGTTTLAGNTKPADVTTSTWRFVYQPSGSVAVIDSPNLPNSTVSDLTVPGLYILEWVFESNQCRTISDIVRIEMYAAPSTANAGPDDTVACQTSYQTAAVPPTVGIGTWSFASPADDPSGGDVIINNPNSPVTTLSNITALGTYVLTWTVNNGPFTSPSLCQPSSDTVSITFNDDPPSIADAGPDQDLCNVTSTNMNAVPVTSGVGTWTQASGPNNANIASANSPTSPMLGLVAGVYDFVWTTTTTNNNGCESEDHVLVTIYSTPSTADAGPDQVIPQFSPVVMNAVAPTVGTGQWSQVSGPTIAGFTNNTSPTTTVTGTVSGTYVFLWTVSNGNCNVSTDQVIIRILSVADLELSKTITPTTGNAGDIVTFNITVFNNNSLGGSVDATNVSVRDYIPVGYTLVPGSANFAGMYNTGDNTMTWSNLTIPNGDRITLSFRATINPTGSYLNIAEVIASDQFDPDSTPNNGVNGEDDQDNAAITLDVADLSLQKSVSPSLVSINDNVIFTITATNSGPNNATGVSVRDQLPAGYTYISDNGNGAFNNTTGIWTIGNLNNGNSATIQITARVNVATTANYNNFAEIQTANQFDPDSTPGNGLVEDDRDNATITLEQADLELTKTVFPTSASAGQTVTFTLNVVNNGPGNATNVAVQDIIPVGYTLQPGSVSNGGTYQVANSSLNWNNLTIANGASLNLTFNAVVNPSGSYLNTAQIMASDLTDPDSTPNNDDGDQSEDDEDNAQINFIGPSADLSLTKTAVAGNTSPVIGSQISFELVISNDGPNDATGVEVTDLLPSGYQFVNYSSSAGLYNEVTGIWNVGNVGINVSESLIIDAIVLPTGNYTNITQVTASNLPDPDSTPNNDDGDQSEDDEDNVVVTPIATAADLSLTKQVDNPTPLVGTPVIFEIVVSNDGPQDAGNVAVTDLLPSGYLFTSFTATSGTYDPITGIWTLDILANSESETLQLTALVRPTGDYLNIAEVSSSDTADPDSTPNNGVTTEDDYATAITTPSPQTADLSVSKTVNNPTPVIGTPVTFGVVVTNNGPQATNGVELRDLLPSGYTFSNFAVSTGTYNPATGVWIVGSLVSGKSETLQIIAIVNPTGNYTNTVEVTASSLLDPDSTPNNGITTEDDYAEISTTPIPRSADLSLTKKVDNLTPLVGTPVTFEIVVTNNGPQDAGNVTVTDLIPSGYAFTSFSATSGTYDSTTGLWSLAILPNSESETLQLTAIVLPTGDYLNIAEVYSSDTADPDSTPNNGVTTEDDYATAITTPSPQTADLSVTKTVNNPTPVIGTPVTFGVVVTNNGPQATNGVELRDLLPSGYTFSNFAVSTGTYSPATGVWIVGSLVSGKSETLQIIATVNATGDYLNTVEVTASSLLDPDSTPNNNVTTEDDYAEVSTSPIPQSADLSLTKTVNNPTPLVGSNVTFEITVTNSGPQDTAGVTVTDLLPSGYSFVSYSTTLGSYDNSTGLWTVGAVAVGESHTLQIIAAINPTGDYSNAAEVTASNLPDPDSTPNNGIITEDDYATATITPIAQSADLALTKTVNNPTPLVGSPVTFEVVVTNNGPQDTAGVTVTDLLPSGYTFSSYSSTIGTYDSTTGLWTVGALASGGSHTLQITAVVNPAGTYLNTAEVTASSLPDPNSTPANGITTENDYAEAATTPIAQSADLALTKTVNNLTPLVGSTVTFEVVATNNGPQDTVGVTVTDLLPNGYTFSSYSSTIGTYDSSTGLWTVGNLANGGSHTLQITVIVNPTGTYLNTAEVTASSLPDPNSTPANGITTENDYAEVSTAPIAQSADLALTKTVNNAAPLVGSSVTFEVVVTNNGPQDTANVTVTDLLPSGYTFSSYSSTIGTYNNATGLWTVGALASGGSHTLQITAIVNPTGTYLNTAEVTASSLPDPNSTPANGITTENDYAEATTAPIAQSADLALTKTVNNATPLVGSAVTFEVVVTNNGPQDTAGVTVTDLLPSGYTFSSYSSTIGTYDSTTGLWTVGNLANGGSHTLQITAVVNATGNYLNTTEVTASSLPDPNSTPANGDTTENDYAEVSTTPIEQSADLSLTKTVNNPTPLVGSLVTFEIVVTNNGPQDTANVTVTDLLPNGYTFSGFTVSTGTYDNTTGLWTVGNLGNGESETLQITAVVNATGTYLNTAEVTASSLPDPNSTPANGDTTENDYAEVSTTPIAQSADLSLNKTVNNATPLVGSTVTFEVVVTNNGPQDTAGVTVTDLLPSGYTFSSYSSTIGTYDSTTGLWTVGALTNGGSHTLQITAIVNPTGNYLNTTEVTASSLPDPNSTPANGDTTENDYAEVSTTPIEQSADLSLTKTVNNPTPLVGSLVTFEIVVTNNGPQDTANVTVTDLLPNGYTFSSYSSTIGTYNNTNGLWTVGNLANGGSHTLQITAVVNPTGTYLNTAEVTASSLPDPNSTPANGDTTENDYSEVSTAPIAQSADLALTKTVNNAAPLVGSLVIFEVTATNSGPNDAGATFIRDLLPTGYTFVSASSTTGSYDSVSGLWTLQNISASNIEVLQIIARVNSTGDYLNTTEIISTTLPDPDSTPNNGVTTEDDYAEIATTPISQSADLALTKTVNNATPLVGSQVTFEVVVTNNGPQDTANVTVTDLLPDGYTFSGFTVSTGTYNNTTGLWTIGNLTNGESQTLQITAIVNPTGNYLNTAEVTASSLPDPNSTPANGDTTENDYAEAATTPIAQSADLALTKTVNNAAPLVGSTVTFEVVVTNNGPQDTAGVTVTDLLPNGYTFSSYSSTIGTYDSTTGLWTVGNLANGGSHTLQITAVVNPAGIYLNTAEVTASSLPDPNSTPTNGDTTENDYAEVSTTPIARSADLALTKTVNNAAPLVGTSVTFEVVVTNNGPQDTAGVTVTDLLPSGYTFSSYSSTIGTYDNATGLWTVGALANGGSHTLQITAIINPAGTYLNTAEVTASSLPDPNSTPANGDTTENDYAEVSTAPIAQSADLALTKTVNNAAPLVGSQVTFEVVVTNNGPQDTANVTVTDLLPNGYNFSSYSSTIGTYNNVTGLWTVGNLANGGSHTLQITAVVNPAGIYLNTAEVTASSLPDPNSTPANGVTTENDYAEVSTAPIAQSADLSLTKTVNNPTPLVGSQVTFEVVVTNNGPQDTANVTVTDLLPDGYNFSGFTVSTGTYNNTTGLWTIGNLINGKSETLQILAVVNPTGVYLNTAEVTASSLPDPDSTPNNGVTTEDDYAEVTISPNAQSADLALTKTVNNATPLVGSSVIFEIIVANNGPQNTTAVTVTDLLPSGYTFSSYSTTKGTYNATTGIWNIGSFTNGDSQVLQITAVVNATGDYTNIAEVTASGLPDPNSTPGNGVTTENDYGTATTAPIGQSADLSLTKTVNNAAPLIGTPVTFEIIITNNGPQNTTAVEVTDLLPSGYTFGSFTATKGTYNNTSGIWNIGSLSAGDSQTLQLTAIVNPTGNYTNVAEITSSALPDPDSTPNNGIATEDDYATAVTTPVAPIADLSLQKALIGSNFSPIFGATITFELTVKNDGPQMATGVTVRDLLPSGYEYVLYSSTTGVYFETTGIWNIGNIPSGASESLLISVKVNNTGNYRNIAEVFSANELDPDSTPNNGVEGEDDMGAVLITPVPAVADLSIEKTVVNNELTPNVGAQISFSITVSNDGPSAATGVTIKDILPQGYDFIFYNATSGSYNSVTGEWTPGIILPGNSHTLLLNVFVKTPTGTADEYLNTAEIMSSDQFDPDSTPGNGITTEDDYDSISVTPVIVQADLSIEKKTVSGNTTFDVGGNIIFEVTVTNDGPGDASGVMVKDLLPAGFTYLSYTATSGVYNFVTGDWNTGIVTAGNTQTLQIYVRVNPPSGQSGEYVNITEITASNLPDPDSTPNNGVTTEDDYDSLTITVNSADLNLDKTVSNKNANVDEVVTYTLQIGNDGPVTATGVAVEDIIPLGLRNISNITNGGIFSLNTIKWVNLTVPVGGITLTYNATVVNPEGLESVDYVNIAQITASNQFDPDSTPNNDNGDQSEDDEDSEFINIPSTDIAINKDVDKTDVPMNSEVIFTITAENLGILGATNVEVQDHLPKGYEFVSSTVTSGSYNQLTGIWTIPSINGGTSQTLTLTVKVVDFNDYLNTAHLVKLDQIDTNSSNNQDSASVKADCFKIYNEFSPNDDGQNDTFYIDCIDRYPNNQLEVFNRWGNLVYFKKGYNNTWDGKAEGSAKTLPEGTYFYILDLGDGSKKTSGWLYLK